MKEGKIIKRNCVVNGKYDYVSPHKNLNSRSRKVNSDVTHTFYLNRRHPLYVLLPVISIRIK